MDALALARLIFDNLMVRFVLALIAGDLLTGIALAFYTKEFRLGALGDWFLSRAIPYLIGAGSVELVLVSLQGGLPADYASYSIVLSAAATAVWVFVIAALVGKLLDNLKQMGLPVPTMLTDLHPPVAQARP